MAELRRPPSSILAIGLDLFPSRPSTVVVAPVQGEGGEDGDDEDESAKAVTPITRAKPRPSSRSANKEKNVQDDGGVP